MSPALKERKKGKEMTTRLTVDLLVVGDQQDVEFVKRRILQSCNQLKKGSVAIVVSDEEGNVSTATEGKITQEIADFIIS